MLVAGIETVWSGFETPGPGVVRDSDFSHQDLRFEKGEEIGRFSIRFNGYLTVSKRPS